MESGEVTGQIEEDRGKSELAKQWERKDKLIKLQCRIDNIKQVGEQHEQARGCFLNFLQILDSA